jgi:DNA-binding transcriptional regulator YiaG
MSTAGSLIRNRRQPTLVDGVILTLVSALSTTVYTSRNEALVGAATPVHIYETARLQVPIKELNRTVLTAKRTAKSVARAATMVRELLDQLDISKASLAHWLGVTRPTLYAWADGGEMRDSNLERITALNTAVDALVRSTADGKLPPLWQHQRLPNCGTTFAQGMRAGLSPGTMASELEALWKRDAQESAAVEALFRRRV